MCDNSSSKGTSHYLKTWLKWFFRGILAVAILMGLVVVWNKLQYFTPHPLIPHNRVSITLPFTPENEVTNLISMGETIEHNYYGGHPGIDFQWDHSVPLIAVVDGTVANIATANDMKDPVLYLTLKTGEYQIIYKELAGVATGIEEGVSVKKGDVLGYPHCRVNTDQNGTKRTGCQLHWEFGYDMISPGFNRLCPLTYFDEDALKRINAIWDKVPADNRFKQNAPYLCSNIYHDLDE